MTGLENTHAPADEPGNTPSANPAPGPAGEGQLQTAVSFRSRLDAIDRQVSSKFRLRRSDGFWHTLAAFMAHSGDSWFWLAGLAGVWLWAGRDWHNKAALLALGVCGLAVVVLTIKKLVGRKRPEGEWGAIYRATDPHSFPSGHAARATMLAVMALGLGPAWFGLLVLLWSPLVSLARVIMGVHYLSDVIAGAVLGLVVGILALELHPLAEMLVPFLFH